MIILENYLTVYLRILKKLDPFAVVILLTGNHLEAIIRDEDKDVNVFQRVVKNKLNQLGFSHMVE